MPSAAIQNPFLNPHLWQSFLARNHTLLFWALGAFALLLILRVLESFLTAYFRGHKQTYDRKQIPSWVKQKVWRRDGGRCVICGGVHNLQYDHEIPVSRGGANTVNNIRILCQHCNSRKGARIE